MLTPLQTWMFALINTLIVALLVTLGRRYLADLALCRNCYRRDTPSWCPVCGGA